MNHTIDFLSPVTKPFALALVAAAVIAYLAVRFSGGSANRLSRQWPIWLLRGLLLLTLLSLFFNPVRVTEQKGTIQPSQVFFMLDASESMAIGNENGTPWDKAVDLIQGATKTAYEKAAAEVSLFRFGRRLKAIGTPDELGLTDSMSDDGMGVSFVEKASDDEVQESEDDASPADEPDTQLFVALRQISSRFGRKPPSAVVVFSDGRARDAAHVDTVATAFSKLGVPVHAVPLGNADNSGDVALVSLVVPDRARKQSEVEAQAFLRSYGFDGKRVEIKLNELDENGRATRRLATVPVTLESGFQSVPITFRTDTSTEMLEAVVSNFPNEEVTDNNRFETSMEISREKIRVLYVEGSRMRAIPTLVNGRTTIQGPGSSLQNALQEDVDIECVNLNVSVTQMRNALGSNLGSFPKTVAELSAFDCIVLSDVPRRTFTPKQLEWIENWVKRRGGGLCMVGGRNSFGGGGWAGTEIAKILPVQFQDTSDWRGDLKLDMQPDVGDNLHPFLKIAYDENSNRRILTSFPSFHGANVGLIPKPNLARVLAVSRPNGLAPAPKDAPQRSSSLFTPQGIRNLLTQRPNQPAGESDGKLPSEFAGITTGRYGKGRTMAMCVPITGSPAEEFLKWGRGGNRNQYYASFWRNAVYWLTEQSYVGRRRLIATADKRYYGPGETVTVTAYAFNESANETTDYELVASIEPHSLDIESEFSIVRWPNNVPREEEVDSPFTLWGEAFEIPKKKVAGKNLYQMEFTLAETLPSGGDDQSFSLELTASEDSTQVDSTSIPIQILYDPFEQQNPFPNHELMHSLAEKSGGKVLEDESDLAKMITSLPVTRGPSEMRRTPIWSNWWVMASLLGIVSAEWCYRRWIGLA